MTTGTILSIGAGVLTLIGLLIKWKMFPNKIRKDEDEERLEKQRQVNDALEKMDVEKVNELWRDKRG